MSLTTPTRREVLYSQIPIGETQHMLLIEPKKYERIHTSTRYKTSYIVIPATKYNQIEPNRPNSDQAVATQGEIFDLHLPVDSFEIAKKGIGWDPPSGRWDVLVSFVRESRKRLVLRSVEFLVHN